MQLTSYCNETEKPPIISAQASGESDQLHYLFATEGGPTVLVMKTTRNATMSLTCSNETGAINLTSSETPQYIYGFTFNKVNEKCTFKLSFSGFTNLNRFRSRNIWVVSPNFKGHVVVKLLFLKTVVKLVEGCCSVAAAPFIKT